MSFPKNCELCGAAMSSIDDNDWHGYGNCIEITDEMWRTWEQEAAEMETFDQWWQRDGKFYDPDTDDVPWFDKRKELAERAFEAAKAQSRNYIADDPTMPERVRFANGRRVMITDRTDGVTGYYLTVDDKGLTD